jgi:multidrug efflux pump subunit AcrB
MTPLAINRSSCARHQLRHPRSRHRRGAHRLMILLFLGSWRSTVIIATSIPLSILTSIIVLSLLHETINIMTLGGLALAVGILVDDATVEVENIHRNLAMGKELRHAILDGAQQIAVPAFVATLCICIVFLPMFMLGGVARYLFVPLAEAVVFAMLASYLLSRTLVPTLAMYLLKAHEHARAAPHLLFRPAPARLRARFREACAASTASPGAAARRSGNLFVPVFLFALRHGRPSLVPWLGEDFFPSADSGEFILHVRGKHRPAHRGNGAPLRSGGGDHPQGDSPGKSTTSSTTSGCLTAR